MKGAESLPLEICKALTLHEDRIRQPVRVSLKVWRKGRTLKNENEEEDEKTIHVYCVEKSGPPRKKRRGYLDTELTGINSFNPLHTYFAPHPLIRKGKP